MALLAQIDIDDQGSLKIARFTDLLEALGATTLRTAAQMQQSGQQTTRSTQQQTDALTRLIQEHRNSQAAILGQVRALTELSQILRVGTAMTTERAEALRVMNVQVQNSTFLTQKQKTDFENLSVAMRGTTAVTEAQSKALRAAVVDHQASAQAALGHTQANKVLFDSIGKLIVAIGATGLASALKNYVKEAFEIAARNEVLSTSLSVVAKNVGHTNVAFETQAEIVRRLGITTEESREAVLSFAQAELSLAETSKVARAAQDLAVIAGKNSSDAFETLKVAIETMQPRLLRQFGILTNLNKLYSDHGKEIGKTGRELSSFEQRQAVLNLILSEAEKVSGAYEAAMNNVGKQMGSTARFVEELQNKVGQGFLPVMNQLTLMFNNTLGWLAKVNPSVLALGAGLLATTAAVLGIIGPMSTLISLLTALDLKIKILGLSVTGLQAAMGWISVIVGVVGLAASAWMAYSAATTKSVQETIEAVAKIKADMNELDLALKKVEEASQKVKKAKESGEGLARAQDSLQAAVNKLNAMYPGLITNLDLSTGAYTRNADAISKVRQELNDLSDVEKEATEAQLKSAQERVKNIQSLMNKINEQKTGVAGTALSQAELAIAKELGIASGGGYGSRMSMITGMPDPVQIKATAEAMETLRKAGLGARVEVRELLGILSAFADFDPSARIKAVADSMENFDAAMKKAGFTRAQLDAMTDLESLETALNKIRAVGAKMDEDSAKWKQAYKEAFESITETANTSGAALQAASDALNANNLSMDEYIKRLSNAKGILAQLEKMNPAERAKLKLEDDRTFLRLDDVFKDLDTWEKKYKDVTESIRTSTKEMFEGMRRDSANAAISQRHTLEDMSIQYSRSIEARQEDLSDRVINLTESEVDRRIKENERYFRAFQRQIDDEIREIERRHETAQKLAEDKHQEDSRSLMRTIENAKREFQIKKELDENYIRMKRVYLAMLEGMNEEEGRAKIAQIKKDFDAEMDLIQAEGQAIINARLVQETTFNNERRKLDEQHVDNLERLGLQAVEVQIETNRQIIKDSSYTWNLVKEHAGDWASSLISGFGAALVGAKSFKESMIDIFKSMAGTLMGIVNDITGAMIRGLIGIGTSARGMAGVTQALGAIGIGPLAGGSAGVGGIGTQIGLNAPAGYTLGSAGGGAGGLASLVGPTLGLALAGGAGGFAGYGVGRLMPNRGLGGLSGAASGALVGTMIMPGIGTGVGALAGLIGGLIGGGSDQRRAQQMLEEYLDTYGGKQSFLNDSTFRQMGEQVMKTQQALLSATKSETVQALTAVLERAKAVHTSLQQLRADWGDLEAAAKGLGMEEQLKKVQDAATLTRPDPLADGFQFSDLDPFRSKQFKEAEKAAEELAKALQLDKAKEGLAKTYTAIVELRKQTQLLGFDVNKLYNAKTIEEFNAAQTELNQLLERQQIRVDGIGKALEGVSLRVEGFNLRMKRSIKDTLEQFMSPEAIAGMRDAYEELLKERNKFGATQDVFPPTEGGFAGFLLKEGRDRLSPEAIAGLEAARAKAQADFNALTQSLGGAMAEVLATTGDFMAALQAVQGPYQTLIQLQEEWGFEADESFNKIKGLINFITDNPDIVMSLQGIKLEIQGWGDAGLLTEGRFNDLGEAAAAQFELIKERTSDADTQLMLMQPTLQALWEAQQTFGFKTDEATQKLIDMGVEHGIVGQNMKDINKQILDILLLIAEALGAELPDAYKRHRDSVENDFRKPTTDAAEDVKIRIGRGIREELDLTQDRFAGFARHAKDMLIDVGDAATRISLGASPGGLKEIPLQIDRAIPAIMRLRAEMSLLKAMEWDARAQPSLAPSYVTPQDSTPQSNAIEIHVTTDESKAKVVIDGRSLAEVLLPHMAAIAHQQSITP